MLTIDGKLHRVAGAPYNIHTCNCSVILQAPHTLQVTRHIEIDRVERQNTNAKVRYRM